MAKIFVFLVFAFTTLFGAYENELANFDKILSVLKVKCK